MALDANLKMAIKAKLKLGLSPKVVAEQLDVKLPTVYSINQKMQTEKDDDMVQELHSLPQETIQHVIEEAKVIAPQIVEEMQAVSCGAEGLKKLDMSFQTTMTNVLRRFDLLLLDKELPLKDVVTIANTTAIAYEKVFASGTNIHIGDNNNNNSRQLTVFKNKQGV